MSVNTHGIRLHKGAQSWRSFVELLSAMRFAIALLSVICIASIIGTVLKQGEPVNNYVNQFGPFWTQIFGSLSLFTVYSAWWFLLILAFLVLSTSLCISRTTPTILREWSALKEGMRARSLSAFAHRAAGEIESEPRLAAQRMGAALVQAGWKVNIQERNQGAAVDPADRGFMVAAKTGAANKVGYIAAHSAIVLVCVGGLLDGDLFTRMQLWFGGKSIYSGGGLIADVPKQHRLGETNPAFRANLLVVEGSQSGTAILNQPQGILLQELPFSVELKKFIVEYYSTGMPKLFASDIVIHDRSTGVKTPARVEVNHPVSYKGIEIYQSSFDDGGSAVKLTAVPLNAATQPFELEGTIGGSSQLSRGATKDAEKLTVEYAALRVINVENFAGQGAGGDAGTSAVDVRKVDLKSSLEARLGSANKVVTEKKLRNVGPSITYRLRDGAGQAKEFHNYMLPMDMGDGVNVFLLGVRETQQGGFRYLRVPADDQGNLDGFVRLRTALQNTAMRSAAVQRYAKQVTDPTRPELAVQLAASANRAMDLFAGASAVGVGLEGDAAVSGSVVKATPSPAPAKPIAGLQAVAEFIDANVPAAEREKASDVLVRILNGSLFELNQQARMEAGLQPLEPNAASSAFMAQAVFALGDAALYPAPMALQLKDFTHVQASVFQVARAPGKSIVYLGCFLLIVGVFCMLYVRERRLWVWLSSVEGGARSSAQMALSSNRRTMDIDNEFARLKHTLLGISTTHAASSNGPGRPKGG